MTNGLDKQYNVGQKRRRDPHLLVFHASFVSSRPKSPRIAVDDISNQNLSVSIYTEFDLHVYQSAVTRGPSFLKNFKNNESSTFHNIHLIFCYLYAAKLETGRNDLLIGPLRIMISIILEKCLLQRRVECISFWDSCKIIVDVLSILIDNPLTCLRTIRAYT